MKPAGTPVHWRTEYYSEKRAFSVRCTWYPGYSQAHVRKIFREKARRLERNLQIYDFDVRWEY